MAPAAYLDPAAAAAESGTIPPEMLQQVLAAQEEDNGSGYTAADDAAADSAQLAGNSAMLAGNLQEEYDQVYPPVPDTGDLKFPVNYQQELLAHPELNSLEGVQGGNMDGGLVGTVRNGRTSTWVTEALHNPASGAGTAVA
jgi:hypothetical protein